METNALLDTGYEVSCIEKHLPNIIIQDIEDMMNLVMVDGKSFPLWYLLVIWICGN